MTSISLDEFNFEPPSETDFLITYNELIATAYRHHFENHILSFSPTLNRLEAQTKCFEQIEMHIQLSNYLDANPTTSIIIPDNKPLLVQSIKKRFKERIIINSLKKSLKIKIYNFKYLAFFKLVYQFLLKYFLPSLKFHFIYKSKIKSYKKNVTNIIITYFDHRNIDSNNQLREEYFGNFSSLLSKHSNTLILFKFLHYNQFDDYSKINHGKLQSIPFKSILSPWQQIRLFIHYLLSYVTVKKGIKSVITYKNYNISPMINQANLDSYFNMSTFHVMHEYEIAKALSKWQLSRIFFPYENQTWEKVYPIIKHKYKLNKQKIIGYQHSGVSYKLLNYFPSKIDQPLPIFPDKILTVGQIFTRLLSEKAYYPSDIKTFFAYRFKKHQTESYFKCTPPLLNLNKALTYAFSYDQTKYSKIIQLLIESFQNSSVTVFLRFHPDYDSETLMDQLSITLPPNFKLANTLNWETLYNKSDLILYDDNSIGIEGIIHGLKTFYLDVAEPIYNCHRMFEFECWKPSISKKELLSIKASIENGTFDKSFDHYAVEKFVNQYYSAIEKDVVIDNYI